MSHIIWHVVFPLALAAAAIVWMWTWDWGGDSQCSSLSATERKGKQR